MEPWRASNPACSLSSGRLHHSMEITEPQNQRKSAPSPDHLPADSHAGPTSPVWSPRSSGQLTVRGVLLHNALQLQALRDTCPCSLQSGHDPYLWSKTQLPQAAFQDYGPTSIISFTSLLIHSMYIQQVRAGVLESTCLGLNPVFPGCLSETLDLSEP